MNWINPMVKYAYLICPDSPRQAFYRIWIEGDSSDGYRVWKESGGLGKVSDRRSWPFESLEKAEKFFDQKVRGKTSATRKTKRTYRHAVPEVVKEAVGEYGGIRA